MNRTRLTLACGLLTLLTCAGLAAAEPAKYFHLDFVLKEMEGGKVTNTRHYLLTAAVGGEHPEGASVRSGSKVPIATEKSASGDKQMTYLDVGVNLDCRSLHEVDGGLEMNVLAEISNAGTATNPPLIRQTKWSSNVLAPLGKPTLLFTADNVTADKGQLQLEVTATPAR